MLAISSYLVVSTYLVSKPIQAAGMSPHKIPWLRDCPETLIFARDREAKVQGFHVILVSHEEHGV